MMSEHQYPGWVINILKDVKITIYRGKSNQLLKEKVPLMHLRHKVLSIGESRYHEKAFVLGFEDEEDIWNECVDIIVKIYKITERSELVCRVEISCLGVNRKEIYYKDEKILEYEGYSHDSIKSRKSVVGTVIFDEVMK